MSNILEKFDHYLKADGPAAIVTREPLIPVEGPDGVIFPSTYAANKDTKFEGGYNIDEFGNGKNIALIDSVGSQANRIEPIFSEEPYMGLAPQIIVIAGKKRISLFEAGHRAGDAIIRCSSLQQEFNDAFNALLDGDATSLAKIAPTSLVFGVWDSRDTQAKLPRLIASTIRAYDVNRLTRSAQFNPALEYIKAGLLDEAKDVATEDAYSKRGFIHVPATNSHGGIIANGGIRRDATLAIAALKLIHVKSDAERTLVLRRYILGLALVAFTKLPGGYLRQGTILVSDPENQRQTEEVYPDGSRKPYTITHEQALEYAKAAAKAFGVGESREVNFEADKAKSDLVVKDKKSKAKK